MSLSELPPRRFQNPLWQSSFLRRLRRQAAQSCVAGLPCHRFGKPVRRFGDLLLCHKITVTVLLHRLVDNPGDVVVICVRLDNPAVGGKCQTETVRSAVPGGNFLVS